MRAKAWQVGAVAALVVAGSAAVHASSAAAVSTSFSVPGALSGVAATSPSSAWAVGSTASGAGLIVRWNGRSWRRQAAPRGSFAAVAAVTARNAWAVGTTANGHSLVAHWNGRTWKRIAAPSPGRGAALQAVSAVSASDVWAVGAYFAAHASRTLLLHWNGRAWAQYRGARGQLSGVDAVSSGNAWAVGSAPSAGIVADRAAAWHWNGRTWSRVSSPAPVGNGAVFRAVTTAGRQAWTVGCSSCAIGGFSNSLASRWTGHRWTRVRTAPPGAAVLAGVAGASARNVWAVGGSYVGNNSLTLRTLAEHWTGVRWRQVRTPDPGRSAALVGVAVVSARNAWAVGSYRSGSTSRTLIVHWNGSAWS